MEDVHQLRVFAAVAEHLSFTRAAEVMFLTQSAVSHQVARLEQSLGAPLFDRDGRKPGQALGKSPYLQSVFVTGDVRGQIAPVRIVGAYGVSLAGELLQDTALAVAS